MTRKSIYRYSILLLILFITTGISSARMPVYPGAYRMSSYLPLLKNKKVAVLVNPTSEVNGVLLPDTLLHRGVHVVKIFSPEHGFRGIADAGAKVSSSIDNITGLPIISLYGSHKKPNPKQMQGIDIVIYDIQDVGVRFYTYISTLQYMMEACAEANVPLLVLDRPDPLGFIVDGPVLNPKYQSFVGMQPIPVIYGMTPGEYAEMLIGEHWLSGGAPKLTVIRCANYTHEGLYQLPVSPSPNLKNMAAIYLYPSLCLFEGTKISVGRGTKYPFQQFGHPALTNYPYTFLPKPMQGATHPKLQGKTCHGLLLAKGAAKALTLIDGKMKIKWLLEAYRQFPNKEKFFTNFFNLLAGNNNLQQQIKSGATVFQIRKSWQPALNNFKKIRAKYLLYPE